MKKRIVAILLITVILVSVLSISVFASASSCPHNTFVIQRFIQRFQNHSTTQHYRIGINVLSCTGLSGHCTFTREVETGRSLVNHIFVYNAGTHSSSSNTHTFVGSCICGRTTTRTITCRTPCNNPRLDNEECATH